MFERQKGAYRSSLYGFFTMRLLLVVTAGYHCFGWKVPVTGQALGVVLMMTSEKVRALSHVCLAVYSLGC